MATANFASVNTSKIFAFGANKYITQVNDKRISMQTTGPRSGWDSSMSARLRAMLSGARSPLSLC